MTTVIESPAIESDALHIPLKELISDEELIELNRRNPGWKIELGAKGELEARMIAGGSGSRIVVELVIQFGIWCKGGGGGALQESDGTFKLAHENLGDRTWAPDVSWISPPSLADATAPERGFWRLCPTFVIEVRSPSDTLAAQQRRMAEWLQFGVELGWLVDPIERTVWIYRPNEEPEQLNRPDELSGESVLEGLTVDMSEVWALASEDSSVSG